MGNQMQKALDAAGEKLGAQLGDMVTDAIDRLESQLDDVTETSDNNTDAARDANAQEEPRASVEELRSIIDDQNAKIDRLVDIMGKMITKYGASVNDSAIADNQNTSLDDGLDDQPTLSEIKLG